jgi:uncharacterized protein
MSSNTIRTRNVALNFLGHISRGEIAAALTCVADDVVAWVPGHPDMTKAQLREFLEMSLERFVADSMSLKPIGTTAEGERVAVEAESNVLLKAGGRYTNRYHFLFVVREGKISAMNVYAGSGFSVDSTWSGG